MAVYTLLVQVPARADMLELADLPEIRAVAAQPDSFVFTIESGRITRVEPRPEATP